MQISSRYNIQRIISIQKNFNELSFHQSITFFQYIYIHLESETIENFLFR